MIEELATISRTAKLVLDGKTHVETGKIGNIIKTVRKSDSKELIIMNFETGSFVWNADNDDWNDEVSIDPESEDRWVAQEEYN